jgi:hypothetical protein
MNRRRRRSVTPHRGVFAGRPARPGSPPGPGRRSGRSHSSAPAARSSANRSVCSRSHTPPAASRPCAGSRLNPSRSRARAVGAATRSRSGVQHGQDPLQRLSVRQRPAARIAEAPLPLRQQRLDPLPQPVGDDPRRNRHRHLPARRRIPTPLVVRGAGPLHADPSSRATAASRLSRRASRMRSWRGAILSRQIASYSPKASPSTVCRTSVPPSTACTSNQC